MKGLRIFERNRVTRLNYKGYKIAIDNYVYTFLGKQVVYLGEGAYEKYRFMNAKRFNKIVEDYLAKP